MADNNKYAKALLNYVQMPMAQFGSLWGTTDPQKVSKALRQEGSNIYDSMKSAFTAPVRSFTGEFEPKHYIDENGNIITDNSKAISEAMNLATNIGTGGIGATMAKPVESGSLGMFAKPSKYVPKVNAGEELIVHHNIPQKGLANVHEFGGQMAVPSLAISKSSMPLDNFGEISLIGSPNMAKPSRSNPVYSYDAYTKRFPRIEMQGTSTGKDLIKSEFATPYGKFYNESNVSSTLNELTENLRRNIDSTAGKIKFLEEIGQLPDPNSYENYYDFYRGSRDKFMNLQEQNPKIYDEFINWGKDKVKQFHDTGEFKDVIYAGTSNQTGRQKYVPATIDNFVKQMKGNAGEEGGSYGLGQLRAKTSPKLSSFKDVQNARDRIVSNEDFMKIKDALTSEHDSLQDELASNVGGYYANHTAEGLLEDIYGNKYNPNDEYTKQYANAITPDILSRAQKLGKQLKDMPTEYFEAKPQRAVSLGEFQGAIIPKEATQQTKDILNQYGIKDIYEYASPEERTKLYQKFGNQMFMSGLPYILQNENNK